MVESVVANVSRCVTGSSSGFGGVGFVISFFLSLLRAPERDRLMWGLCVVINLDVLIIYSIPSFQLLQALFMRRRMSGVRGIRVSSVGRGIVEKCVW